MKLLLDENLSRRLVPGLQEAFAGTPHVEDLGLQGKPDTLIWAAARQQAYALVSKDDDFRQLSLLRGAPPKVLVLVLVLAIGNGGNADALGVLLSNRARIEAFDADALESLLLLRAFRA